MMLKDVIVSFHLIPSHMWITDLGLYLVSIFEAFDLSFIKHGLCEVCYAIDLKFLWEQLCESSSHLWNYTCL